MSCPSHNPDFVTASTGVQNYDINRIINLINSERTRRYHQPATPAPAAISVRTRGGLVDNAKVDNIIDRVNNFNSRHCYCEIHNPAVCTPQSHCPSHSFATKRSPGPLVTINSLKSNFEEGLDFIEENPRNTLLADIQRLQNQCACNNFTNNRCVCDAHKCGCDDHCSCESDCVSVNACTCVPDVQSCNGYCTTQCTNNFTCSANCGDSPCGCNWQCNSHCTSVTSGGCGTVDCGCQIEVCNTNNPEYCSCFHECSCDSQTCSTVGSCSCNSHTAPCTESTGGCPNHSSFCGCHNHDEFCDCNIYRACSTHNICPSNNPTCSCNNVCGCHDVCQCELVCQCQNHCTCHSQCNCEFN